MEPKLEFLLRLGDSALILGHRVSEWCGHGPMLEEDIALANTALDLIGQATLWLEYAAEVEGKGRSADDLAYLRDTHHYRNLLICERPNGDFAQTIMRSCLFDAWSLPLLQQLSGHSDAQIAAIAAKSAKEATYHMERSLDLCCRLGDGTEESHARMQSALDDLWPYTGEMFLGDATEDALGIDLAALRGPWLESVRQLETVGTLKLPDSDFAQTGGKTGRHSEHLGYLLAEMQFLQRAYPGGHMVALADLIPPQFDGEPVEPGSDLARVWAWLDEVPDPEIPVISLVDLGVIRDLIWAGETLEVTVTPTYSGCPATAIINMQIEEALRARGVQALRIKRQLAPAWTTDWMSENGRAKLEAYGIAPPRQAGGPERCPHCRSARVERVSQFGSTPCKAQWRCNDCLEPFDYFKCI